MKQLPLLFLFVFFASTSFGQNQEAKFLIDTTITIMKKNAVNSSRVDWPKVEKKARELASGIDSSTELGPVMRYLFEAVDDFHGAFFYGDSSFRWVKETHTVSDSIMNEWKKGALIKQKMLEGGVGYLRIPTMVIRKEEEFHTKAQSLNDSLCKLLARPIKGIILDLRVNGGGAMHPMILGIQNLLRPGKVGSFDTQPKEDWLLQNNSFAVDTHVVSKIKPGCTVSAQDIPVVILTSRETGSSGEFLIMALRGRPNTVILGAKTAGWVTVNSGFPIRDIAFMNLSIGYGVDTNGKVYTEAIEPDIYVDSPDSFNDLENDVKIKAAKQWIMKHHK